MVAHACVLFFVFVFVLGTLQAENTRIRSEETASRYEGNVAVARRERRH